MSDNSIVVEPPKRQLPLIMKLMIVGVFLGVFLLGLELFLEHRAEIAGEKPHWSLRIIGHIGTGIFVATLVGIGIDRLFHHEHLSALAKSIESRLKESERRTCDLIPGVLSNMAEGRMLRHIHDKQEIYRLICSKLEQYPCFLNTIINVSVGEPSQFRLEYYQRKIELVNKGKLTCRELITSRAHDILKKQLDRITPAKKKQFVVGVVGLDQTMGSFVNFCIFQRDYGNYDDAFLMLGWFSDPQLRYQHHRHTCVVTDHPELVRMFCAYFEIMEKTSKPYTI